MHFIIADNQPLTRMGMRAMIGADFGSGCRVTDVTNKRGLIQALTERKGSVVVLDYALSDLTSVEELLILGRRFSTAAWLLCANEMSEGLVRRLSAEPRVGLLLKECSADEVHEALRHAARGERFVCHQIAELLSEANRRTEVREELTATEREILRLIARGLSVKEIAAERISSTHTIVTHKKNLFRKLGVNNVYEATKYALRAGLVEMAEYYI